MRRRAGPASAVLALVLILVACAAAPTPTPKPPCPEAPPTDTSAQATLEGAEQAVMVTNKGTLTIELYPDVAPLAAANFVALARCGFYDGISFHRVLAGFVIQAGDPQTKTNRGDFAGIGTGGPGYSFEIEPPADELAYEPYVVSMANALRRGPNGEIESGADSNGSQFFINLADLSDGLPRDYTIFGRVIEGTEVVDEIGQVPVNDPQIGVPLDPVIIESISIRTAPEETPAP
jgi:cyclophilin family peptidyl-prolyl cis-trans isomerase